MSAITLTAALRDIRLERWRQNLLLADGSIDWDCADPSAPDGYKLAVLTEELGEVARAVLENGMGKWPPEATETQMLREELIQVAAVATAWAESLA